MANLSIRRIDEDTLRRLRIQAASNGVSMEEQIRRILKQAAQTAEPVGDLAVRLFSPAWADAPLPLPPREIHAPLDFTAERHDP